MRIHKTKVYKFYELSDKAKEKALIQQVEFEIEVMDKDSQFYDICVEMEANQTPWFLGSEIYNRRKQQLIDIIKINEYEFYSDGSFFEPK